jgi:hypothetical protein
MNTNTKTPFRSEGCAKTEITKAEKRRSKSITHVRPAQAKVNYGRVGGGGGWFEAKAPIEIHYAREACPGHSNHGRMEFSWIVFVCVRPSVRPSVWPLHDCRLEKSIIAYQKKNWKGGGAGWCQKDWFSWIVFVCVCPSVRLSVRCMIVC